MKTTSTKSTDKSSTTANAFFDSKKADTPFFVEANAKSPPFFNGIQAKLKMGQPGDRYEKEADTIAEQLINGSKDGTIQQKPLSESITPLLQAKKEDEEMLQSKPIFESPGVMDAAQEEMTVQAKDATSDPSAGFEQQLSQSKGGGTPLPASSKSKMETSFGTDFGNVRTHTDSHAIQMSRAIGAQAFTHGNNIYFNEGKFNPGTEGGDRLLAHELVHTLQQGGGVGRKVIQKTENGTTPTETNIPLNDIAPHSDGKIEQTLSGYKIRLTNFPVKRNLNTLIPAPPYQFPKGNRDTNQVRVWKKEIQSAVKTKLKNIIGDTVKPQTKYMLSLKGGQNIGIIGTVSQLTNELIVPPFNQDGVPTTFEIEHILDWQIAGGNHNAFIDSLPNLILLEANVNRALGQRVKRIKKRKIQNVLNHYRNQGISVPQTAREALKHDNYEIYADTVDPSIQFLGSIVTQSMMVGNLRSPISSSNFTIREFQLPENHFLLSTSARRAGYIIPYSTEGYTVGSFKVTTVGDPETHQLTSLSLTPIIDESNLQLAQEDTEKYEVEQINTDTYRVQNLRRKLRNLLTLRALSPIALQTAEIGPGFNLKAGGKVLPSIPLIQKADIQIQIDGSEVQIFKEFNAEEFDLPNPFVIDNTTLSIGLSTQRGLFVNGRIDFGIQNVGKGYLGVAASTGEGFALAGGFNFDSNLFDPAEIEVSYENKVLTIDGRLGIPQGKVKGIRSATIKANYSEGTFAATGNADLEIPGIERGELNIEYVNDTFVIGGQFQLSDDIPGIRGGSVGIQLTKTPEGEYQLRAEGSAQPDIPGVDSNISILYDNGIFTIEGNAAYERGILSGEIQILATNRSLGDDGQPTDEVSESINVYGGGILSLQITPWLVATAGVKLLPNGEIEVMGRIELPDVVDVFARKSFDRNLFRMPPLEIPIFAIPLGPRSLGVVARITGGLDLNAGIGPGQIRELFGEITYNPSRPEQTLLRGGGQFVIPADASLTLRADLGLGLSVGIASLTGGIELAGSLGLEGEAAASVDLNWSPQTGFELNALGSVMVNPKFSFDINAFARASLDLFLVSFSETWRYNLAAFEWGPDIQFGVRFPIQYIEGEAFDTSLDDLEFVYPDLDIGNMALDLGREIKDDIF